jgi:hypothetical protein
MGKPQTTFEQIDAENDAIRRSGGMTTISRKTRRLVPAPDRLITIRVYRTTVAQCEEVITQLLHDRAPDARLTKIDFHITDGQATIDATGYAELP